MPEEQVGAESTGSCPRKRGPECLIPRPLRGQGRAAPAMPPPPAVQLLKRLVHVGAPRILLRIVWLLCQAVGCEQTRDCVETFAGHRAVTLAMRRSGLQASSFEVDCEKHAHGHGVHCNWLSAHGFLHALTLAMSLRDGGQSTNAPVCSSWTWINRSTSQRSVGKPLGAASERQSVAEGNEMVARLMLYVFCLAARGAWWVVEQPAQSLLEKHPRVQAWCATRLLWRVPIRMGEFGAETETPTWLYSAHWWARDVTRYRTRWWGCGDGVVQLTHVSQKQDGSLAVTGMAALKESQQYPSGFGEAMAAVYLERREELRATAAELNLAAEAAVIPADLWSTSAGEDEWEDAGAHTLLQYLLQ